MATALSRFASVDPLGDDSLEKWRTSPQKWNLYAYCQGRPLVYCDPLGCDVGSPDSSRNGGSGDYGSTPSGCSFNAQVPENLREPICLAAKEKDVDPHVLAGIASRETDFGRSKLLKDGKGDHGHGHGLTQIDDRSHKKWIEKSDWKDAKTNLEKGAEILKQNLKSFKNDEKKAVAAYNCGAGNVRKSVRQGKDPDARTAHGSYGADVLKRAESFRPRPPQQEVTPLTLP
jgi:hypothetical protein